MTNILILGAGGSLAAQVIPELSADENLLLTLFVRRRNRVRAFENHPRIRIIEGDVLDMHALTNAMRGQDIVYAGLAGVLEAMARNVATAMADTGVRRLIWVSSMGIYGETGEDHGAILKPYRRSAAIIEASGLDYTILRPAWFTNGSEIDYALTQKGEAFRGSSISRRSLAHFIGKLVRQPEHHIGESLGLAKC
ncbi:NAD(P)H-binding protein [Uruburuella testudinis]|uniref:NAD(P)H-binding protein n=1 Tax=Uruburuella testudinis TaxID=1282863 RepID=A0ABY4DPB5_9NEIS|nr:NAD(P)H-binding protein [Uruburuella testudinis]UOO80896.1 NAD(P)H-binding protein [Uruburuella testudinis]